MYIFGVQIFHVVQRHIICFHVQWGIKYHRRTTLIIVSFARRRVSGEGGGYGVHPWKKMMIRDVVYNKGRRAEGREG